MIPMRLSSLLLLSLLTFQVLDCAAEGGIVAYVVPHSHDDVGWLYTIDEYYNTSVQHVYDTVVQELSADPSKRFISVEMAYFYKWWTTTATAAQQDQARAIIKNKQMEFVSAGWVMQDEACATFSACVDQMTEGHQFVLQEFGAIPQAGWQIDPFGATGATASMFAMMGFQSHIIDRINISLTDLMEATQSLEFMWEGAPDLKTEGQILTHELSENYCFPMEFGYDFESHNTKNNPPITPRNLASRSQDFVDIIMTRSKYYLTNNVLLPYGCDFHYVNASAQFNNMGQIIDYINAHESFGITIKYATLSEYFDVILATQTTWPTRSGGDFGVMPCSATNSDYTYWTGYYTSRNLLKGHIRGAEAHLRSADSAYVQASLDAQLTQNFTQIQTLRMALAETQHHDGISGTARWYVVDMYHNDLYAGEEQALQIAENGLGALLNVKSPLPLSNSSSGMQSISKGTYIPLVVQNTLAWTRNEFVRVNVWQNDLVVTDAAGNAVPYQINPAPGEDNPYNLFFQASVSPMGYTTYLVSVGSQADPSKIGKLTNATSSFTLSNSIFSVTWDDNLTLSSIKNSNAGVSATINQMYMEYDSETESKTQNSGAYIFVPTGPAQPLPLPSSTQIIQGQYVQEVYQVFSDYISHTVRLYSASGNLDVENFVEINCTVGVLPENKEVIVRYNTDLNNYATNPYTKETVLVHYSDENGYTTVPRYTDYNIVSKLGGNYFPMVMRANIQDLASSLQFGVVSERTHGTASYAQGELELMLHRRVLSDDQQGLAGYPLNDTDVITPLTRLLLGNTSIPFGLNMKRQAYFINFPLVVFYGDASTTPPGSAWTSTYRTDYAPLTDLPSNIHLMSLKSVSGDNSIILRFQHMCESTDGQCSEQVTFDISDVFSNWKISTITETTLSANQVKSNNTSTTVVLNAMEIKTFIVTLSL